MITEKMFAHNGRTYALMHISDTDSRNVIDVEGDGDVLLEFQNDLMIFNQQGAPIGRIASKGHLWVLQRDGQEDVALGAHRDYHWKALVDCEVQAAQILLS